MEANISDLRIIEVKRAEPEKETLKEVLKITAKSDLKQFGFTEEELRAASELYAIGFNAALAYLKNNLYQLKPVLTEVYLKGVRVEDKEVSVLDQMKAYLSQPIKLNK